MPAKPRVRARVRLRLYVAGRAPNSLAARANLEAVLAGAGTACRVEIVDVLETPDRALRDHVLVTPTLVVLGRANPVRLIGALVDREQVRAALGLGGT